MILRVLSSAIAVITEDVSAVCGRDSVLSLLPVTDVGGDHHRINGGEYAGLPFGVEVGIITPNTIDFTREGECRV